VRPDGWLIDDGGLWEGVMSADSTSVVTGVSNLAGSQCVEVGKEVQISCVSVWIEGDGKETHQVRTDVRRVLTRKLSWMSPTSKQTGPMQGVVTRP
jgi:hypothetical protein